MLVSPKLLENKFKQVAVSGIVDGVNTSFTIPSQPIHDENVVVFANGIYLVQNIHYTISGTAITMISAPSTGQVLRAIYWEK